MDYGMYLQEDEASLRKEKKKNDDRDHEMQESYMAFGFDYGMDYGIYMQDDEASLRKEKKKSDDRDEASLRKEKKKNDDREHEMQESYMAFGFDYGMDYGIY